jgi:hypothetical protein
MVGPDDKIITGLGAVVTRFADGLPVVTEHEWRPRLIEPSSGRRDAAPRYLGLRRPAAGERGRGLPGALPARWFLSGVLADGRGSGTPDDAG